MKGSLISENALIRLSFLGQFTEDGSFIGQYVPGKPQQPVSPQPTPHNSTQQPGASSVATIAFLHKALK
ncbi:Neuroglian [Pseudolycoriella hygida]|uniref:Neuroglian n=1 Tax=Pseudolycoriella hygida TaxID=35572 RepID=A0A9Q0RZW0_9DIPT|nr:Neuroglian [Pseudolycoriella hygida]